MEMRMMRQAFFRIASMTILGFLLSGCGSQVSLDNYSKLKVGQSYNEVKQIIGEPAQCNEMLGVRSCVWGDEKRGISVNFVADKVLLLSATNLN